VPTKGTLKTYGLTVKEWGTILQSQGGVCAICKKLPFNGRLCIDHDHAPGWKKMPPEGRKLHIRGLVCFFCNHYYLARALTLARAQAVVTYLERYIAKLETHYGLGRKSS